MKISRLFASLLLALTFGLSSRAQESSDFTALRTKAEKGNGIAQYNLGLAYLEGHGTAIDPAAAYVWLSLARENGARGRALDNLIATFDRETLEAAKLRLASFRATTGLKAPAVPAARSVAAPAVPPPGPRAAPESQAAPGPAAPRSNSIEEPGTTALRNERDALLTSVTDLSGELAKLRVERERLLNRAAESAQAANEARTASRASEIHSAELARSTDAARAELVRAKQALTALALMPKPAPDPAALEKKTRELQTALTELETARNFGRQVEETLNKVNDQKLAQEAALRTLQDSATSATREAATLKTQLATLSTAAVTAEKEVADLRAAQAELSNRVTAASSAGPSTAATLAGLQEKLATATAETTRAQAENIALVQARDEARQQVATTAAAHTVLQSELAQLRAKPAPSKFPDLSGKVRELEAQLTQARQPVAPSYPDLRDSVTKLEDQLAALNTESGRAKQEIAALTLANESKQQALAAKPTYPDLSGKVRELETALTTARRPVPPAYPDLSGRVHELEAQAKEQQTAFASLTTEAAQAKQEVAVATKARDAALKAAPAYPDLSGKVSELAAKLVVAEKIAAKPATPAYPDLSGKVTELAGNLASLQSDRERMQKLIADTGKSLRDATTEVTRVKQEVAGLTTAKVAAEQQTAKHVAQVGALEKQNSLLAESRTAGETATHARVAELSAQLASLRQERDALATKTTELAGNLAALQGDRERMQSLLADTGKKLQDSTTDAGRFKELEVQATSLKGALANAESQATSLTTERAASRQALGEQHAAAAKLEQEKIQLTAALQAALNAAPPYPNLSARVQELEAALAAKPAPPAYPDLSPKVRALETQVAAANQQTELAAKTARDSGQQSAAELSAAGAQISQLKTALTEARQPTTPAYPNLADKVAELETKLAAAQSKKGDDGAQLRHERDELSGRLSGLAGEVAQLRSDRERMQKMLADAGKQMRDATADASRLKELEAQTTTLQGALTGAQTQAASAQAALAAKSEAPAYPDLTSTVRELESKVSHLQTALSAKPAAPAYPDLSGQVAELETQVGSLKSALAAKPTSPTYPDLSGAVRQLETQVATAKAEARNARLESAALAKANQGIGPQGSTPAYPDLSGRVNELEASLINVQLQLATAQMAVRAAAQMKPVATAATVDSTDWKKRLDETEDKLATALRGYALLEKDRDALADRAGKSAEAVTAERNALAAQVAALTSEAAQLKSGATASAEALNQNAALAAEKNNLASRLAEVEGRVTAAQAEATRATESLAALQRTSAQHTNDLATTRALAQQLQGTNSVLATENYQLKTMLARAGTPAGPAAAAPVAVAAPAARTHMVATGDSLSRISERYYRSASRWPEIYNANRAKIGRDGVLRIGTELRIP